MKDNLLYCPICESRGTKNILCEVDKQNNVIIERHHRAYTVITGTSYAVTCGACNFTALIKKGTVSTNLLPDLGGTICIA